jgi:hypothetical protein
MICPNCNYDQVRDDSRFCPNCGHPLSGAGAESGPGVRVHQRVGTIEDGGKAVGLSVGQLTGAVVVVSSLSELETVDKATRRRLRSAYEAQIRSSPEQAGYHLALGLYYLDQGMYAEAVASLSTAHQRAPQDANVLYYLALAHMAGKRPRTLAWSDVKTIESYLGAARRNGPDQAHCLVLWAVLKYDYYLGNGLRVTPPAIEELLAEAEMATWDPTELEHLFRHVPVPPSPLTDYILGDE